MGTYIVTGDFMGFVSAVLNLDPSIGMAFATFILGSLSIIAFLFVVSHLTHARRHRRDA